MATKKEEKTKEKNKKLESEEKVSAKEEKKEVSNEKEKIEKLKEKLKERAKELSKEVKEVKEEKISELLTKEKEEKPELMMPIEDYLKSSVYLGTRVVTPDMRKYVYRRRADGLAVFNTTLLDEKIKEGAEFLAKFNPEDIIIACKRESGWRAVSKFAEIFGITAFTKKYPAGILTNTALSNFREAELVFVCDPWLDKNAMHDANIIKIPVIAICDTNNYTSGITQIIPGNNKSGKSIGFILFLLAKLYAEKKGMKDKLKDIKIQDFVEDWDNLQPPQ